MCFTVSKIRVIFNKYLIGDISYGSRSRAISRLVQKRLQQESEKEKLALESALRVERLRAVEVSIVWHFSHTIGSKLV